MKKADCKLLMLVTIISLPLCLSFQNSLIKLAEFQMQCYRFKTEYKHISFIKYMSREKAQNIWNSCGLGRGSKHSAWFQSMPNLLFHFRSGKDNKGILKRVSDLGDLWIYTIHKRKYSTVCICRCVCVSTKTALQKPEWGHVVRSREWHWSVYKEMGFVIPLCGQLSCAESMSF